MPPSAPFKRAPALLKELRAIQREKGLLPEKTPKYVPWHLLRPIARVVYHLTRVPIEEQLPWRVFRGFALRDWRQLHRFHDNLARLEREGRVLSHKFSPNKYYLTLQLRLDFEGKPHDFQAEIRLSDLVLERADELPETAEIPDSRELASALHREQVNLSTKERAALMETPGAYDDFVRHVAAKHRLLDSTTQKNFDAVEKALLG